VTLTVTGGGTHIMTSPKVVIGRSRDCELRIADLNASRRHAEVRREDDAHWIVDLGSMNGTLLNGRRVEKERLEEGDKITLGSTDIVFGRSPRP
jgi:pSer/pThr/pTyr-binding forkhead associated (FHA) protein